MKSPNVSSLVLLSTLLAIGLLGVACSSKKSGDGNANGNPDGGTPSGAGGQSGSSVRPCEGELKQLCGATCSPTQACPSGLYCMAKACTADCTKVGKQCSGTCTADGHCVPDDGTGELPTTGDAAAGDASMTCIDQKVQFESLTPTVELLIDRSDSMTTAFGNGKDRWNTIRDVLVDPAMGFIKRLESKVRFGLALYTGDTNKCIDLTEVPFGLNNYQMIHDVFVASGTGNNTPTAESLTAVTQELVDYKEVGPKFIVLATDGDPDTCAAPNSNGTDPPRAASVASVQAAWNKHIATYVISVGPEATQQHLQDLAHAGQGGDATAKPYQALDANMLAEAFNTILSGVVSCDFDLNGEVAPADAGQGNVSVGGTRLVYQDPNGYEMPTTTSIRLLGDACDALKQAVVSGNDAQVSINFPCGKITIIR